MSYPSPDNGSKKRRSERLATGVFVRVGGLDKAGKPFAEDRWTLNVSFQGCKFLSRYELPMDSWVTLQIFNTETKSFSPPYRSRVSWLCRSQQLRGLFQVGVELETPANIWGIANPPADWCAPAPPEPEPPPPAAPIFEREMKELLALAENGNYYQLLNITPDSPRGQIRQNYYELVRKYHPDRHMAHAEWMPSLHKLMETITTAYRILTDESERQKYDEWLGTSAKTFGMGRRASGDSQDTAEQCVQKAKECFKAQNSGGAIVWMRKASEMEPTSPKYHALLARALSTVVALRKEAVEHFEKSLEIDPWNSLVRLQLAALYEDMKLPWRAKTHYEGVLEIEPDNAKAVERLRALGGTSEGTGKKKSLLDRILHPINK